MGETAADPAVNPSATNSAARLLVALDIDGTLVHEDGSAGDAVQREVARLMSAGHEVMLATGRSVASTLPVLDQFSLTPEYVVCSNGAITLKRDADAPDGYRREFVETFDPASVLNTISAHLSDARYAVEDETGFSRYTHAFPDAALGLASQKVEFDSLIGMRATRVVVVSPDHAVEDFLKIVERMGLHRVSYSIGWTAWLDIAPDGVNKATALERVRLALDIPLDRVVAVGDGRNDVEMLQWAAQRGRGVAMGQAPSDVIAVANAVTSPVSEDGLAALLAQLG